MSESATTPVFLLKTKSTPNDGYEDYFATAQQGRFNPVFVPVLEHRFKDNSLQQLRTWIQGGAFDIRPHGNHADAKYGAIIFTSQRAVEAFTHVVEAVRKESLSLENLLPPELPLYVVGPATARGLRALNLPCPILGEESGNGEVLAHFILQHYNDSARAGPKRLPILFLVGEQRRDIIPKTLQSLDLPEEQRAVVDEVVVYETAEMQSFRSDFDTAGVKQQWVVVFSPTGCKAMLESLGMMDESTGKAKEVAAEDRKRTRIATIGPTTRDHLIKRFGFEPDVCAAKPSPDGVGEGIEGFMQGEAAEKQSARLASQQGSSPTKPQDETQGTKRKADSTPKADRGKKAQEKKQKTIDETMDVKEANEEQPKDIEMKEAADGDHGADQNAQQFEPSKEEEEALKAVEENGEAPATTDNGAKNDETEEKSKSNKEEPKQEEKPAESTNGGAVEQSSQREKEMPSSIIEKGIIYFFIRNRVGIDEPEGADDLQRSFFVLRPIPTGGKLGDGAVDDANTNRLFALPKKVLPKSHKDRFMAFVEKAPTTVKDLKENFFGGAEYQTKTQGTREQSPVTPIGEGVYAIVHSGRNSHLAYMLTIPQELGEVQNDMGLCNKGSFVISVKNPERKGPVNAQLPSGPDFPKEIIEEFRGLAWVPAQSKYLDYPNVQILLIGEGTDEDFAKALEPSKKDEKHDKKTPQEELEKLEHEDELRVEHLHGDNTVFDDLKLSSDEYPKVPTTW
ncbi:uncharacterized protein K452DRAFT_347988 [Aplosporella prunicola CBS 121167]|uniref:Tetrapyrrole biosynthesis uroporphyrinogen III synthase domain-containing protein n=1 Tax=Aplosporella prunicola CBS 121167 TaxID=1176127 RepID=A0A6A6BW97_9PEZI|nr:uncharacterized protein K452DRAFT_347988 [Aplosporella prunicola CBS 121167]KAF2147177.1 hypothetical protein K452DRAFT_347988 [Aplosporella prunicola CBS 121167]